MRYLISLISLSLVILFSCSSMKKQGKTASGTQKTLAGTTWEISRIPGFELEKSRKMPTIAFSDTALKFGGNGGCNGFGGNYTVDGSKLKLENVLSTMMACTPGMKMENKLMTAFREVDNYEISKGILKLKKGNNVLVEYRESKKD